MLNLTYYCYIQLATSSLFNTIKNLYWFIKHTFSETGINSYVSNRVPKKTIMLNKNANVLINTVNILVLSFIAFSISISKSQVVSEKKHRTLEFRL